MAAVFAAALLPLSAPAAPAPPDKDAAAHPVPNPREGLDRTVTLKIDKQSLSGAVALLRDQTKLNIVLDTPAIQQLGVNPDQPPVPVQADLKDVKVRAALRTVLLPYNLTFVVIGDTVIVTTEDVAAARQMAQRVNVHLDKVEFAAAMKQMARQTGVNLALDPRAEKEATAKISLDAEDVPLETAVRLLSEMAGLKPVRAGNTLFVTKKEVAAEMRADPNLNPAAPVRLIDSDRETFLITKAVWQQGRIIQAPPVAAPIDMTPVRVKESDETPPADPKDANPPPAKDGDK